MNLSTSISLGATEMGIAVLFFIVALHLIALRFCPSPRRWHYLAIFASLAIPSLFIMISDGSGHITPLPLLTSYEFMLQPHYYSSDAGMREFDIFVFGIPIAHQLIAVGIAWMIARTMPNKMVEKTPL